MIIIRRENTSVVIETRIRDKRLGRPSDRACDVTKRVPGALDALISPPSWFDC